MIQRATPSCDKYVVHDLMAHDGCVAVLTNN